MPKSAAAAATAFILVWLSACASVSVDKVSRQDGEKPQAPKTIYVKDFGVPPEVLRVDRGGKSLEAFRRSIKKQLTLAIVERANKHLGIDAVAALQGAPPARSPAWMVTGRFVTVNQGSRALRAIVGLGAGGTKVRTDVVVYDYSGRKPRVILKFETSGGSNAMPGAAFGLVMPNYYLLAADVVGKVGQGLNVDVVRTSRQIVAALSEYMGQEGYLSPKKVYRSKKLGKWP